MSEIPTSDWTWINTAADRFEQEWKKGARPRIEDFLIKVDESRRPPLLEELLRVECELLHRAGAEPDVEEYRRRFPDSATVIDVVFGTQADRTATDSRSSGPDPTTESPITPGGEVGGDEPAAPGTRIRYFGDYELIREIGRGGMGVVYRARQISLNRPVALKMIRSAALASDDELRRFQNEAEAVAQLDHPHIVPILEVGNHSGQRYFTMKLIGGTSLNQKLAEYSANPTAAARLMKMVAEAVHHAHQRGILHRDLKPGNVLLDERGEPFVADFGLAKRLEGDSELTLSGAIMGTPAYMAPEQASGRRGAVTTASDVYGLGAILYAVLAGRAPFGGDSLEETLEQVRNSAPSPPSRFNPRVPRDLEITCLKCLEKDPSRRYASADALASDLGRWLTGEPIAARPVGNAARFWMWCRRRRVIAGLSAGLVVAVLGGLIGTSLGMVTALRARKQALEREQAAIKAQAKEREQAELANLRLTEAERARMAALYSTLGDYEMANALLQSSQTSIALDGDLIMWVQEPSTHHRRVIKNPDPQTIPLRNDEIFGLEVRLSEPAYIYLIWVGSEGEAVALYPGRPDVLEKGRKWDLPTIPEKQQIIHLPPNLDRGYPMSPGPGGWQSIVLLARRVPLDPKTDLSPLFREIPPGPLGNEDGLRKYRDALNKIDIKIRSHFDLVRILRFTNVDK